MRVAYPCSMEAAVSNPATGVIFLCIEGDPSRVIHCFYPMVFSSNGWREGDAERLGLWSKPPYAKSVRGLLVPNPPTGFASFSKGRLTCASVGSRHTCEGGCRSVTAAGTEGSLRTRRAQLRKARKGLLVSSHGDVAESAWGKPIGGPRVVKGLWLTGKGKLLSSVP